MSRSSRRAQRAQRAQRAGVPAEVVLHQPVPFDDRDLPETLDGVTSPQSVPQLPALGAIPSLAPAPGRLPSIISRRGMGTASPHAKASPRRSLPIVNRTAIVRVGVPFNAKQIGVRRGRLLFNRLAVSFPRRAVVCVKRKQRREVIFAKKFSGRNGGKVYRRTYESRYAC